MDRNQILRQVDDFMEHNRASKAEALLQKSIVEAVQAEDSESLLAFLNDLLGHYRETSRVEESYIIATRCINLAVKMGLEGTIPYATTLLNVANAYRAGGRLQDSLELYLQVQDIYAQKLPQGDPLFASFENNLSLLYQELGRFAEAKDCLLKAQSLLPKSENATFEQAVTHANLATTCLQLDQDREALDYATLALSEFDSMHLQDAHYGAALTALGTYHMKQRDYEKALPLFQKAQLAMEQNLGKNEFYYRIGDYIKTCKEAIDGPSACAASPAVNGLGLCRSFYETYGRPMLQEKFPEYLDRIAVGLMGEGSDCLGYDDAASRDHDWGPGFCLWITEATYDAIGKELEEAYAALPKEFKGCKTQVTAMGQNRRGVKIIERFFIDLTGAATYEQVNWQTVSDAGLLASVSGAIFSDPEGLFTERVEEFRQGYPAKILCLKIAEALGRFSQNCQYNYKRMSARGDSLTASMLLWQGIKDAMQLAHYLENQYPPHDKWLKKSLDHFTTGRELLPLFDRLEQQISAKDTAGVLTTVEAMASYFAHALYEQGLISDTDTFLGDHIAEILYKSAIIDCSVEELVDRIVALEFTAFDKVKNIGGRASCQDDFTTFSIMRKSQYLTWDKLMLMQYLYDFDRELGKGHNLIEEKYGRMMESTSPAEYAAIKDHFPVLTPEKKSIIEQIVALQVGWMEEFAAKYPTLGSQSRSIHTYEDNLFNTSYETYLRGELGTYSDKMLELYGRYIVSYARRNNNLAFAIMTNSVHLYGYDSLDAAENSGMSGLGGTCSIRYDS